MAQAVKTTAPIPALNRFQPETADSYVSLYNQDETLQDAPLWLKDLRYGALAALQQRGLPTQKLERWKYSAIQPWLRQFTPQSRTYNPVCNNVDKIVGSLWESLAAPPQWLKELLIARPELLFRYGDMMLWDLNSLFLRSGLLVDVPAGMVVEKPVDITMNAEQSGFYTPRTVIRVGEGARLSLIETLCGADRYWHNGVTHIILEKGALLRYYRFQEGGAESLYTASTYIDLGADSQLEHFNLNVGASMSRHQIHARTSAPGASCNIYGINLLRGRQHADLTVEVEHAASHCTSGQFVRSVVDGQAHGVFQGKVYVAPDAQKTDGYQLSKALILSEGAEMDTRPELEIYADDVKCSHGATTGRLENDPLFYLRSRGIPEAEARALLISAFIAEIVDKIADEPVKNIMGAKVEAWLSCI